MLKAARDTLLQAYPNAPWRRQVQVIGGFAVIIVFIALLAAFYLNISVQAATLGREIQEMQIEILELQRSNADQETSLAELTSAANMLKRAEEMGFRKVAAGELDYLPVPGYRPRSEAALAPPPDPAPAGSAYPHELDQTLFDWLKEKLSEPGAFEGAAAVFGAPEGLAPVEASP